MKNFRVIFLILLATFAGYLTYPYLNSDRDISKVKSSITAGRKYPSGPTTESDYKPGAIEEKERPESKTPPAQTVGQLAVRNDQALDSDSASEQKRSENTEGNSSPSKSSSRNYHFSGPTFRAGTERDFTTYKLKKTDHKIDLSSRDPRLLLIKGFYEGFFDRSTVDLEIGGSESSIQFVDDSSINEELSFSAPNEEFFANVHDNGNLLLIEKGKSKVYINIQSWPTLKLIMGTKTEVILRKTR